MVEQTAPVLIGDEDLRVRAGQIAAAATEVNGYAWATAADLDGADSRVLAELVRDSFPADRAGVAAVFAVAEQGTRLVVAANSAAVARGFSAARLVAAIPGMRGEGSPELACGESDTILAAFPHPAAGDGSGR